MARKILLADDSVTAQNMGRRILGDAGYEVITVNNGSTALKKIAELKPDVIILDVYMPGYGGLEVCLRLKESPETSRIPVLITVGKMEPFKAEEANRVKADAFLVKPFETNELLTAIAKLEDKIVPEAESQKKRSTKASASDKPSGSRKSSRWSAPDEDAEKQSDITGLKTDTSKTKSASQNSNDDTEPTEAEPKKEDKLAEFEVAATSPDTGADSNAVAVVTKHPDQNDETASEISSARLVPDATVSAEAEPVTFASADNAKEEARETAESKRTYRDTEVVEALASLVPMASTSQDYYPDEKSPSVPAFTPGKSGPHWVAQSVPLSKDEVGLMLENEMQKAYAASAAAEGARTKSHAVALESLHEEDSEISDSSADSAQNGTETSLSSEQSGDERTESKWKQDIHAAASQETEPRYDSAKLISAVSSVVESSNAEHPELPSENYQDVFAAAASVGATVSGNSAGEAKSQADSNADEDRVAESSMASAWENWDRIRETIVGPNLISGNAEEAAGTLPATGFKDLRRETRAPIANEEETAPAAKSSQASEISSIVDSMLAELKPKLMEEIARKMSKDFKKD
ncbi:MAG: hypothetical protein NVS1B11_12980 [Terriglobales bacterium]